MRPSSRSQSAATTALRKVHGELFRVKLLREIPQWWILGRCAPPTSLGLFLFTHLLDLVVGGGQRPKIHQCGISRNRLTLKSSHIPAVSAVVAADWLRLDGGMET